MYVFDLLFTTPPALDVTGEADGRDAAREEVSPYTALRTDPPEGCWFTEIADYPALRCVRHGPSRLSAIGGLVAQVRDWYGVEADDLGFEKLWEWAGTREWRERMVAQLLLMAAQRARLSGLPIADVVGFVRAAMAEPSTSTSE